MLLFAVEKEIWQEGKRKAVSMASKMRRKLTRKIQQGERRALSEKRQAERAVKVAAYNKFVSNFNAETETMDNMLLLWLYGLYQVEGYVKRLEPWYKKCRLTSACVRGGYVTISELAKILKDERNFELKDVSSPVKGESEIVLETIDDMLILFSYVTYEVYHFRAQRLGRLVNYISRVSNELENHRLTIADIEKTMKTKDVVLVRRELLEYRH